jgi:hypothetical protein
MEKAPEGNGPTKTWEQRARRNCRRTFRRAKIAIPGPRSAIGIRASALVQQKYKAKYKAKYQYSSQFPDPGTSP